jgi:hypothetical protein
MVARRVAAALGRSHQFFNFSDRQMFALVLHGFPISSHVAGNGGCFPQENRGQETLTWDKIAFV